ncbi:AMP-binding protein, partial [Burkholderia cenocepacia]|uniref:AMP-binding protein n=1 Tax=Burkholderia cenocepacia TaxID=95486 RepID=UPI0029390EF0
LPLPGITAAVVDETGQDVPNGQGGILVVKRPWPAMIRTIWGDPERFKKSYYPEELGGTLYLAGDGTVRDKETGYFTIMGRIDDVLNVSGHRLGTMEIESALVSHELVADVFWCTADIGWVTGHTYITYGPLACGGTQVVFEGVPTYPDAGRFWKMIGDHKVTVFYTAPTAIRSLIKAAEADDKVHPKSYDLSSLRIIGTVGEPINPEAWMWYHKHVGHERCPIVDTWWQTETGGHMITPLPGATPTVPGSCTLPLPGITAAVVDETGQDVPNGQGGILVVKRPWPAMIRTIWGDPERFKKSYYPEELGGTLYLAGDGTVRDKETGYFTIMGRIDDVLNVSGHRLGTMEIESALVSHELVAEAAVVGRPDDTTGEAVVAFVVLKRSRPEGDEAAALAKTLRDWVGKQIGPIAKPKDIRFGDNLPKTRSGKIMRRLLRSLAKGEAITQDTSTLENPAILEQLTEVR